MQQRSIHQPLEQRQVRFGHLLGRLAGAAAAKNRQLAQHPLLGRGEALPGLPQNLLHAHVAQRPFPRTLLQNGKPRPKFGHNVATVQRIDPARRQLNRQRMAAQQRTNAGHQRLVHHRQGKAGAHHPRMLEEEAHRVGFVGVGAGVAQGRHGQQPFGGQPQRLAGRHQALQPRQRLQQPDQVAGQRRQMLAIVEQQQHLPVLQKVVDLLPQWGRTRRSEGQRLSDGGIQLFRRAAGQQTGQRHPPDAIGIVGVPVAGSLQG